MEKIYLIILIKWWPLVKNVLREIECAIVTDKIKNNKEEILKWVNENVKI